MENKYDLEFNKIRRGFQILYENDWSKLGRINNYDYQLWILSFDDEISFSFVVSKHSLNKF